MENSTIKFNTIGQWTASSAIMSVQAVELEKNEAQLLRGQYAVRICFPDTQKQEQILCVTFNAGAAREFCELMARAITCIFETAKNT